MNFKFGVPTMSRRDFIKASSAAGLVFMGAGLAGCGGSQSSQESSAEEQKTVNIAVATAVVALDPIVAGDSISMGVITNCCEGLFVKDIKNQSVNGLCDTYEVSDDQMTYRFHIRDGAKWSNGDAVTADDFVYAWQRNALAENGAADFQYQIEMAALKNYEDVLAGKKDVSELGAKAADDQTIEVTLEHPVPFLLDLLAFTPWAPVQKKFREEKGSNFALTKDDMLYCGPYTLTQYDTSGNTITLTKNPDYWDAANVDVDVVNLQVISDTQQAVMAYENGTVDYVQLTGELVNQYKDDEGFEKESGNFNYYLMMNTTKEGLSNENFRIAIAYALNREDICENVLKDGSTPVNQMCMVGLYSKEDGTDFASASPQLYAYDTAKAQEAWEKAKQETDVREFTILYNQERDFAQTTCAYIQDTLQKTLDGLTINLESTPKKNRIAREGTRDFEVCFHAWGPDYADPTAILAMYESNHPSNYSSWKNDEFDATYEKANTTDAGNADARWSELMRCNEICTEQAVCIPIYQTGTATITKSSVKGITEHITGIPCYYKFVTKA